MDEHFGFTSLWALTASSRSEKRRSGFLLMSQHHAVRAISSARRCWQWNLYSLWIASNIFVEPVPALHSLVVILIKRSSHSTWLLMQLGGASDAMFEHKCYNMQQYIGKLQCMCACFISLRNHLEGTPKWLHEGQAHVGQFHKTHCWMVVGHVIDYILSCPIVYTQHFPYEAICRHMKLKHQVDKKAHDSLWCCNVWNRSPTPGYHSSRKAITYLT